MIRLLLFCCLIFLQVPAWGMQDQRKVELYDLIRLAAIDSGSNDLVFENLEIQASRYNYEFLADIMGIREPDLEKVEERIVIRKKITIRNSTISSFYLADSILPGRLFFKTSRAKTSNLTIITSVLLILKTATLAPSQSVSRHLTST